jgi:PmbA protein
VSPAVTGEAGARLATGSPEVAADHLVAVAERVLSQAGDHEQVEVVVAIDRGTEVRVYDGDVESLSAADTAGIGVRIVVDGRQGFAWAGTLDDDAVAVTLAEARDNARFGSPDEHAGLAEPDGVAPPVLEVFHPGIDATSADAKVALAIDLERATRSADARITGIESAEYADSTSVAVIMSTTGMRAVTAESVCWLSVYPLAGDGDAAQTGFGFSLARQPGDLDPERAATDAARRATRMLGAVRPATGRATLVLDPWVTAQLLEVVGMTLTGDVVQKGRSLFAGRTGEVVAAPMVTLVDDPTNPEAFSAATHDGEGMATRRNVLVTDGVLQGFVHNATTARRGGTTSTGNAVRRGYQGVPGVGCTSLALRPGTASQEQLVAAVGEGILVADVAGMHSGVNPVSGDVSVGAEGLRIRRGALAEPLREFTIASTIQRLLTDIDAVGADLEWLPMGAAGVSLVVRDVSVSGE